MKGQPFGQECKMPHAAARRRSSTVSVLANSVAATSPFARQFLILQRAFTLIRDIYSTHTQRFMFYFCRCLTEAASQLARQAGRQRQPGARIDH